MGATVVLDLYWVSLIVGTVLPVVVALVTARLAPGSTKTAILLGLALIAAIGQELIKSGGTFVVKDAVAYFVVTLFTAIGAHFGVLQPLRITGKDGAVQAAVPGGVGNQT